MEPILSPGEQIQPVTKSVWCATIALITAFVGLALAIFGPEVIEHFAPKPPPPKLSEVLADTAITIRNHLQHKPTPTPPLTGWHAPGIEGQLSVTGLAFAFVGLVLGSVSWLRHEDMRFSTTAIGIAIAALAWQQIIFGVAAIIAQL